MSLSKQEMNFLLSSLKTLVSKVGSENPVKKILRRTPRKPSVSREKSLASKLVFFNGQNPPTDYGRYRSQMGG
jgi:hypothetical protein